MEKPRKVPGWDSANPGHNTRSAYEVGRLAISYTEALYDHYQELRERCDRLERALMWLVEEGSGMDSDGIEVRTFDRDTYLHVLKALKGDDDEAK